MFNSGNCKPGSVFSKEIIFQQVLNMVLFILLSPGIIFKVSADVLLKSGEQSFFHFVFIAVQFGLTVTAVFL